MLHIHDPPAFYIATIVNKFTLLKCLFMKNALLIFCLLIGCKGFAQQDSTTIWVNTQNGNIYTLDVHNGCTEQLYCTTGKEFMDIAHIPNGNLYGNTLDSLYRIFPNGQIVAIGKIPQSAALVGLNDSILFISSAHNLLSVNVNNAETRQIGYVGYTADGDLTWMGNQLYLVAQSYLFRVTFNSLFEEIEKVDSILLGSSAFYTPAIAATYLDTVGYTLIAFPGNIEIYKVDTVTGNYQQICINNTTVPIYGASTLIFPHAKSYIAINKILDNYSINVYPNPNPNNLVFIEIKDFYGNYNDLEIHFFDVSGRLIKRDFFSSSIKEINLDNFPSGLYLINIRYKYNSLYKAKNMKK